MNAGWQGNTPSEPPNNFTPAVNKFASDYPDPLAFLGEGRKRDVALSRAARERRLEAGQTANILLQGGLRDYEVYAATDGDTMLDLATCGLLRDFLGRPRRRWRGFADEAHAIKTRWGREYGAFCEDNGITQVTQVVIRAPVSVTLLSNLRTTHATDSARLGDRLRYGRKRIAQGFACDLISAEVRAIGQQGGEVDLHFHLAVRGSVKDCRLMRAYFEAAGWAWWDSLTGGSEEAERYPGALAQYESKSIAESIRQANKDGLAFSPENLAELHRQTRRIAMTRAAGAFRVWKGNLDRGGLIVAEDQNGRLTTRLRPQMSTLARLRERLFTSTGACLLRLVLHDFGDGERRPAMRVRGREDISFAEVAATYNVDEAITAARRALLYLGNTAIPESSPMAQPNGEAGRPLWPGRLLTGLPEGSVKALR